MRSRAIIAIDGILNVDLDVDAQRCADICRTLGPGETGAQRSQYPRGLQNSVSEPTWAPRSQTAVAVRKDLGGYRTIEFCAFCAIPLSLFLRAAGRKGFMGT